MTIRSGGRPRDNQAHRAPDGSSDERWEPDYRAAGSGNGYGNGGRGRRDRGGGSGIGGFLNAFLKHVLPDSPTKDVFTYTVSPGLGPIPINLLVLHFTLGPINLELSPMSLIGVALAYVIARSLF